jgi:hypothetical protein
MTVEREGCPVCGSGVTSKEMSKSTILVSYDCLACIEYYRGEAPEGEDYDDIVTVCSKAHRIAIARGKALREIREFVVDYYDDHEYVIHIIDTVSLENGRL